MQGFRDVHDYCGVKDLGINGFPFTMWIRLDRGVASIDWMLRFPTIRVHHLDAFHSDHKSIMLITDLKFKQFYCKGPPFHFEAMLLKDKSCETIVKDSWVSFPESSLV